VTWKSLGIPKTILKRTQDQQRGWVSWRVRKHYRGEEGKCSLFGDITGYRWHFAPEQSMEFDVRGRARRPRAPSKEGVASLQYRGKDVRLNPHGLVIATSKAHEL
jgi:hypothetical protein